MPELPAMRDRRKVRSWYGSLVRQHDYLPNDFTVYMLKTPAWLPKGINQFIKEKWQ